MRVAICISLILICLGCNPFFRPFSREKAGEAKVFSLINEHRKKAGLAPLSRNRSLDNIAYMHTRDMVGRSTLTHEGFDGSRIEDRLNRAHIDWREAGENVARNKGFEDSAKEASEAWMKSDGHRHNVLSAKFTETGIAAISDSESGYIYYTQVFVLKMPK